MTDNRFMPNAIRVLTPELFDLADRIRRAHGLTPGNAPRPTKPTPPKPRIDTPYLTVEEAAEYCQVAVQTVYNNRRHIERQPGVGKLLFTKEALDNWLNKRRRKRRS